MRRLMIILFVLTGIVLKAQNAPRSNLYTVIYNQSLEHSNFPAMIGATNVALGNNKGVQIGFGNVTYGWQSGSQFGLLNLVGEYAKGARFGIINYVGGDLSGVAFGIINYAEGNQRGALFGIVNTHLGDANGIHFGVLNLIGNSAKATQFGVINAVLRGIDGVQFGVVNLAKEVKGTQFGVINIADTYKRGMPFGLFSFIKHGGYQAVEFSTNELFPVNIALKTGVEKFYTSLICALNPDFSRPVAVGVGLGSIVPMNGRFYFNPELNYISTFQSPAASFYSIYPNFGYRFNDHFSVLAAPSLSWQNRSTGELNTPFYSLYSAGIDRHNELYIGLRFALRYYFNW